MFDSFFVTLLVAGVVLIIVCLIVRDQTQFRLSRLRSEVLALRSEEKRLSERRDEIELMVAQIGDAIMRADRRCNEIDKGYTHLEELLGEFGAGEETATSETPETPETPETEDTSQAV